LSRLLGCFIIFFIPACLWAQSRQAAFTRGLHQKTLAVADTTRLDTLSVEPGSVRIANVPDSNFTLFAEQGYLTWKHKPAVDSVQVTYRTLGIALSKVYSHKDRKLVDSNYVFPIYHHDDDAISGRGFVDFNQLDYKGSYGRSISLGNNQDVSLNSQFNMQMSGYVLDSVKLDAAITDNTVPFQPDGNTQRLQEFDQVFIHLQKDKHELTLGDYALERPPGYFLNFYKRVQGVYYRDEFRLGPHSVNKTGLSGSIAKGQFARNIFEGDEGNQGPYKLTGNNGEQFFIVLAGTERVYINNVLMERGENADYVIDYNTAELRFMPRRMITKDSRIQVEFEYQDRNYLNSLIYAYDEVQLNKKWDIRLDAYSNQDAKNQPYLQTLDGTQKRFLSGIGDSVQNAFYPNIATDTFAANKILYKLIDSTVASIHYDSVFVYSTSPDSAKYSLSFSFVGDGKGDYVLLNTNANGRVYSWVAPVNGMHSGNYAPVQLLIAPKMQQVFTLGTTYNIDSLKTLKLEVGLSNTDPNLFSTADNNTHLGTAARLSYMESRPFGSRDSAGKSKWSLQNKLSYEYVQNRFKAIAPYRNVEFGRDWNVPQAGDKPDEHLLDLGTQLLNEKLGKAAYDFTLYKRGVVYTGYRNIVSYDYTGKAAHAGFVMNVVNASDTAWRSVFFRPAVYAEYKVRPLLNTTLGGRYEAENNAIHSAAGDTLTPAAFAFDITSFYLKTTDKQPFTWTLNYSRRRDNLPRNNEFRQQSHSDNIDLRIGIAKWQNHNINFTGTYRKLHIDDSSFNTQKPEESLLGRFEYTGSILKGVLTGTTLYEFGSGQEQKRSYTYVEVPAGQGVYNWIDYNGDGVQQTNEFEVALYPDQKKFIRVYTPTNEYVKVNYVNFNQSLTIDPSFFWKGDKKKWQQFISRLSDQLSLQIGNRLLASQGLKAYDPFVNAVDDASIIITNNSFNNTFYFNRNSSKWGLDYNYLSNTGKQLLNYGVESSAGKQHLGRVRWNISRAWMVTMSGKEGYRSYLSALSDGRSYHIDNWSAEPSLTWLYRSALRVTTSYKHEERDNSPQYGGEHAKIESANIELRLSKTSTGVVQLRGTYSNIYYNGLATAPVTFTMLDALQKGDNFLWGMSWERKVTKGIEISLEYEGRKAGTANVIHTGRMSLRAIL
jgi:hypothetical protein